MLRLAALGLFHESNSFCPTPTDLPACELIGILRGEQIRAVHGDADSTMAGLLAAGGPDVAVVPLLYCGPQPAGPITVEAFDAIVEEMIAALADGAWDGVLLALHGAAVADAHPDADGEIASRVRAAVGPDVPIGVACDLHGNVSARLAGAVDVIVSYRTNPHVDARVRAQELGGLVARAARGRIRPREAWRPVPILLNILRQNTDDEPMRSILDAAEQVRRRPGVLTASVLQGFPYADVPHVGMSVLVTTDDDEALAASYADELADEVWRRREAMRGDALPIGDALDAVGAGATPVLLLDVGDNIGAGTTGRSAAILATALERGFTGLLSLVVAPEMVARCARAYAGAGPGAEVEVTLGEPETGPVVSVLGTVRRLHDGVFEDPTPTHAGYRHFNVGPTAVLDLAGGTTLILVSHAIMQSSRQQLRCLELDPGAYRAITAKGVQSPLAGYGPVVARVLRVDTPGQATADLSSLPYRHRRRPLWPLDPGI
ncbi:M81 family metallopeptidase [Dactylosporangium sp. CA-139066]|uniref:M81 family metallopeptidase n=1 Tax=Dactylosporangium sp. CA-139066 TaxID=3239930 RepID=UPI003D928342